MTFITYISEYFNVLLKIKSIAFIVRLHKIIRLQDTLHL